ncbi:MAG: N-acetylmuramoyl-L-alanine amidase [Sulfuricaulis sp.]
MIRAGRILLLALLLFAAGARAEPVSVQHLRVWRAPDYTRLVFDVSGPVADHIFMLQNPYRLVVDIDNARLSEPLTYVDTSGPLLGAVRVGQPDSGPLRIVLNLKTEARPHSFVLKPAGPYGYRLVIDLYDVKVVAAEATETKAQSNMTTPPSKPVARRDRIVVIDAGHGGEDPGATGRRYHTREKDVTLAIARDLEKLVAQQPGMRPVMTRNGDYYVGLSERYQIADRARADVFVSIHADAVPGRYASGSSVYALSEKGASSAIARQLADKENASDLIGGVSLSDKDDMVKRVILDLSHNQCMQDSLHLGDDILTELRGVGPVHMHHVAQAGFAVLKSPEVPSVLVETAYISNPSEEKQLRAPEYQHRLAAGIFRGIQRFLVQDVVAPPAPIQAQDDEKPAREHTVRQGETLASIARHYNINVNALRFLNDLPDSDPPIGLKLRIPGRPGPG